MRLVFLGYHISPSGITVARQTVERMVARARQLYEQRPGAPLQPGWGRTCAGGGSGSGLGCRRV